MPDSPAIPSHAILLPLPLTGCYDYRADDVTPGDFVMVPLGKREQIGVVWGPGTGEVSAQRLKSVIAKLDLPPLPAVCRRFVDRVASYTLAPPGAVLRMAMSVSAALEPPRRIAAWQRAPGPLRDARLTPARRRVLAVLGEGPARPSGELAREAGVGAGVIKAMAEAGLLESVSLAAAPVFALPDGGRPGPELSAGQRAAADALIARAGDGGVTLLDGVTGAGK